MNIVPVEKIPDYTLQYEKELTTCCDNLSYLRQYMNDKDLLITKFREVYPNYENKYIEQYKISNDDLDLLSLL